MLQKQKPNSARIPAIKILQEKDQRVRKAAAYHIYLHTSRSKTPTATAAAAAAAAAPPPPPPPARAGALGVAEAGCFPIAVVVDLNV